MGLIYSPFKIFHFKQKLDSLPRERPEMLPPIHVRVKPTNVCNHKCRYCAYRVESLQLGQDMNTRDSIPKDRMLELIEDFAEMGVKAVTFSGGGEPFCYPHLLAAAKLLAKKGIKFASLTNGSKLTGEIAEFFANNAIWLRVSIDGWDDDSYSAYRGVPVGMFTEAMRNMAALKKHGGTCYLGVNLIVDHDNASHIFDLVGKLRDAGVDSVKIAPCIVSNDGGENNRYHHPIDAEVHGQIDKCLKELRTQVFEIHNAYHALDASFDKPYTWCPYLQILPIIGADLNVYSCQDKAYNLATGVLGSIRDRRFKEFWFENKEKFFRINPSHDCRHHCVANGKNRMVLDYLEAEPRHLDFV